MAFEFCIITFVASTVVVLTAAILVGARIVASKRPLEHRIMLGCFGTLVGIATGTALWTAAFYLLVDWWTDVRLPPPEW